MRVWSDNYRFPINLHWYLQFIYWKMKFWCFPGFGVLDPILKPHGGAFFLQLFQNKMTNTRQMPGGGDGHPWNWLSHKKRQPDFDHFTRTLYWMASIVERNISESFCLQYFYRCVFYSFIYFLKRNEFWFVVHLQSKIGLHKTPTGDPSSSLPCRR